MKKHKFNIFPEMSQEEYLMLKNDIEINGYNSDQPIMFYQNAILDGWNRYRACTELNVQYIKADFEGGDKEAIEFVMRTNKRRNLSSSQWAAIAVEAEEIMEELKRAAKERQKAVLKKGDRSPVIQKIAERETTSQAAASLFNTNRQYIQDAQK